MSTINGLPRDHTTVCDADQASDSAERAQARPTRGYDGYAGGGPGSQRSSHIAKPAADPLQPETRQNLVFAKRKRYEGLYRTLGGVVGFGTFILFLGVGVVLGTAIYYLAHAMGSNDAFAVELAAWWFMTDILALSGLRGWMPHTSIGVVQANPILTLWLMTVCGFVLFVAVLTLTLTIPVEASDRRVHQRFKLFDLPPQASYPRYWVRKNLGRSLASIFASLNLLILLG
jgi:hypothetical protein